MTKQEERQELNKKIIRSSLASIVLCLALIFLAKTAQGNGDLIRALILMFTSNFVMLVYLFGLRHYFHKLHKMESEKK